MLFSFYFINPFLKVVFNKYLSIKSTVLLKSTRSVLVSFDLRRWQHAIVRGLQNTAWKWNFSVLENLSLHLQFTYKHKNLPFPSGCTRYDFESKSTSLKSRRFSVSEYIQHRLVFPRPALCDILPTLFIWEHRWCYNWRMSTIFGKWWIHNIKYF